MSNTVNNGIPFVPENTIDPAAGLNESLLTVDALLQLAVVSVGDNAPPGSPANGARYVVGTAPTGAWAAGAGAVAQFLDGAWRFYAARYALNTADGLMYVRQGSTWGVAAAEWTAETVSQAEAEEGAAEARRAWSAQRVRQAIVAWWNGISSAWGRGFVSSADAAAGRTALGLGTAATVNVQTSSTDNAAGRLLRVGAFGLGETLAGPTLADWTVANPVGMYNISAGAPGAPEPALPYHILFSRVNSCFAVQASSSANRRIFHGFRNATTGPFVWVELYTKNTIIGTVSQSDGVPTGAIIQRGSNANGEYVRYADGTQICTNNNAAITTNPAAFVGTVTDIDGSKLRVGRWF